MISMETTAISMKMVIIYHKSSNYSTALMLVPLGIVHMYNIIRPFQIDKLFIGLPSQKIRVGR